MKKKRKTRKTLHNAAVIMVVKKYIDTVVAVQDLVNRLSYKVASMERQIEVLNGWRGRVEALEKLFMEWSNEKAPQAAGKAARKATRKNKTKT